MTTPVGSIKVDLTIDGSKADEQVTKAVTKAVKPALAEVDKLGSALERLGAKVESGYAPIIRGSNSVETGFRRLTASVGDLGDVTRKAGLDGLGNALDGMGRALPGVAGSAADLTSNMLGLGGAVGAVAVPAAGLVATLGALITPAALLGDKLYDLGERFDSIRDKATQTAGLTGEALAQFEASVTKIGSGMAAAPLEQINDAAIDVTKNLHLTGKPLEELTSRLVNLQKFGMSVDINTLGDAFRAFGVTAGDQVPVLNSLYEAASKGSLSINELVSAAAGPGGAALRTLGLSFTESAALIGTFEKAGLDANMMLPGLSKSVVGLAKSGKTGADGIRDVIGQIKALSDAGQKDDAINLAAKLFGGRGAGLSFFDAISRGKIDLESLSGSLQSTGVDINDVATATADWSERWQTLTNKLEAAVDPAASAVFDTINGELDKFATWVDTHQEDVLEFFSDLVDFSASAAESVVHFAGDAADAIATLIAPIGDVLGAMNKFQAWRSDLLGNHAEADQYRKDAEEFFSWGESLSAFADKAKGFNLDPVRNAMADAATKAQEAKQNVDLLGDAVETLPTGEVILKENTPEAIKRVKDLGFEITELPNGNVVVDVDTTEAEKRLAAFKAQWSEILIPTTVTGPGRVTTGSLNDLITGGAGKADGGVLPGYSPGVDNMLVPMSGGEGVLIPEVVKALGPGFIYRLNARYRPGLSAKGYAPGGVVGGPSTDELSPLAAEITAGLREAFAPMLTVLAQIRDGITSGTRITGAAHLGSGALPGPGLADESHLKPAAVMLNRLVTQAFPEVSQIGGWRANDQFPDHPSGRALDIMVGNDQALGDRINTWLQRNAQQLGVEYTMWRQQQWRGGVPTAMPDRGSGTANHQDHVHAYVADKAGSLLPVLDSTVLDNVPALPNLNTSTKPVTAADLPYGHPLKILAGMMSGAGMSDQDVTALLGKQFAAAGPALGAAAGGLLGNLGDMAFPGPLGYAGTPAASNTAAAKLLTERNPAALAAMAGLNVPDYSRAGGGPQDVAATGNPAADAAGRIYADTSALIDRTFSNLDAAEKARHDQVMSVLNQILSKITKDVIAPSVQAGVEAAAPALGAAIMPGIGMADGGAVTGGVPGRDSVPIMGMPGEFMLDVATVNRLGGPHGVEALRSGLARNGGFRFMAAGGPVNANIGADLLGVGQVPVLGAVVNMLVDALLQIVGVQIEQRDTLTELSTDFKAYRGDFKAFDSAGRLFADTSGLTDRTTTSVDAAADERLRVLKLVIDGLTKYVIEQLIVPIGKAVGNSLLQLGSSAISGGMAAAFPGGGIVGNIIGSALTTGGSAGIDIAAQLGTAVAESAISVGTDAVGQLLPSLMPGITAAVFGGTGMAALADPLTSALTMILGGVATVLTGAFGAAGTFDSGGEARGIGLLRKATIEPERMLSPSETVAFNRLVAALERNDPVSGGTTIHAPITVQGGPDVGRQVRTSILELLS